MLLWHLSYTAISNAIFTLINAIRHKNDFHKSWKMGKGSNEHTWESILKFLIQRRFHKPVASFGLDKLRIDTISWKLYRKHFYFGQVYIWWNEIQYFPVQDNLVETLPRLLVDCKTIKDFWFVASSWWNRQPEGWPLFNTCSKYTFWIILKTKRPQRFELKTPNLCKLVYGNKKFVGVLSRIFSFFDCSLGCYPNCNLVPRVFLRWGKGETGRKKFNTN